MPRLLPITDRIGDVIFHHGERDDLDPFHPLACLCGAPYYLHCDGWINDHTLEDMTLYPADPAPTDPLSVGERGLEGETTDYPATRAFDMPGPDTTEGGR